MNWLGVQPSVLFETAMGDPPPKKTGKPAVDLSMSDRTHGKLLGLLNELDEKSIEALFLAAWALRELEKSRAKDGGYRAMPRLPE